MGRSPRLRTKQRRRHRFWHATHDCVAPYIDIILHRGRFWAPRAPVWQPVADIRDRRLSMSPLCWHHDTTSAIDSSGYPWGPRISGCAWNSLPLETRACSSLLTFRRETKSHLFRQSYGWCGAVYSDGQQTSALSCATVLNLDFCKVPPQLCDWQHSNPWH